MKLISKSYDREMSRLGCRTEGYWVYMVDTCPKARQLSMESLALQEGQVYHDVDDMKFGQAVVAMPDPPA